MERDPAQRRVLVVEDEMLIAEMIEEILTDLGFEVVGPVARLDVALQLATTEALDAAILDVTVRGGKVYPVAECLETREVPFLIASGYGAWALPEALRIHPRLTKPFTRQDLEDKLRCLFNPVR